MPNRLANETSPYLRQHADNPVDWYPWGPEPFERARREDKPVLLSIGYASCHWCHVMAHESFEDAPTAMLMNDRFINIKVDREERPDIDSIYMQAVQAMTGHGGWPMTVFLTPDATPYFCGTYFPPEERHGMPSFARVLTSVANAYEQRREDVDRTTAAVREMYANVAARPARSGILAPPLFDRAAAALHAEYDEPNGGFGGAPKFPPTMALEWLLTRWARAGDEQALAMARSTFVKMARGGLHDQIGGGFARYSVDNRWLVPHFEKMLYDNALLVGLGAHLWQATGDAEVRRVTEQAIEWVGREMTSPEGAFYSSYDADSEGHEGRFYVWSETELRDLAGDDASLLVSLWGVTTDGNFEGSNILHVAVDPAELAARHRLTLDEMERRVAAARTRLYDRRAQRVWPGRDDKILSSWNGLMIRALAIAAGAFDRADVAAMATQAGVFVFTTLVRGRRVLRTTTPGRADARIPGFLEDHAALGLAALSLYEMTLDRTWLDRARALGTTIRELFWDDETETFYDTARDGEPLIVRPRDVSDNAIPSGTSLATELLIRLATIFDDDDALRTASRVLETVVEPMARYPLAFGHMLSAADLMANGAIEVAVVGDGTDVRTLAAAVRAAFVPGLVLVAGDGATANDIALLRDRPLVDGRATAYVCRAFTCDVPTGDVATLVRQLAAAARGGDPAIGTPAL